MKGVSLNEKVKNCEKITSCKLNFKKNSLLAVLGEICIAKVDVSIKLATKLHSLGQK